LNTLLIMLFYSWKCSDFGGVQRVCCCLRNAGFWPLRQAFLLSFLQYLRLMYFHHSSIHLNH